MAQYEATIIQELYYKGIINPQASTRSRCTLLTCSMHAHIIGSVAGAHAHGVEQEITFSKRRGQRTHMHAPAAVQGSQLWSRQARDRKDRPLVDEHGSARKEVLCGGKLEDERD